MTNRTRSLDRQGINTLNIAHRGARAYAPENTLQSFKKAIDMGANAIELDVHLTKDHKMVVHHDDILTRCTNVQSSYFPDVESDNYYLSNYTLEEIRSLDAGSWFVEQFQLSLKGRSTEDYLNQLTVDERKEFISSKDLQLYASGEIKIPTLEEVLNLVKESGCLVNIEIKTLPRMYENLTNQVVLLVEGKGLINKTIISSFDHQQLLRVRQLNKNLYTATLTSDRLGKPNGYLRLLDADAYNPGCYGGFDSLGFNSVSGIVDPTSIKLCLEDNFDVNVWTCNEKEHIKTLIGLGVTGLITDIPNRVNEVLIEM